MYLQGERVYLDHPSFGVAWTGTVMRDTKPHENLIPCTTAADHHAFWQTEVKWRKQNLRRWGE